VRLRKASIHLLYETGQARGIAEGEGEGEIKYISQVNGLCVCGHRRSEENKIFPRDLQNTFSDVTAATERNDAVVQAGVPNASSLPN